MKSDLVYAKSEIKPHLQNLCMILISKCFIGIDSKKIEELSKKFFSPKLKVYFPEKIKISTTKIFKISNNDIKIYDNNYINILYNINLTDIHKLEFESKEEKDASKLSKSNDKNSDNEKSYNFNFINKEKEDDPYLDLNRETIEKIGDYQINLEENESIDYNYVMKSLDYNLEIENNLEEKKPLDYNCDYEENLEEKKPQDYNYNYKEISNFNDLISDDKKNLEEVKPPDYNRDDKFERYKSSILEPYDVNCVEISKDESDDLNCIKCSKDNHIFKPYDVNCVKSSGKIISNKNSKDIDNTQLNNNDDNKSNINENTIKNIKSVIEMDNHDLIILVEYKKDYYAFVVYRLENYNYSFFQKIKPHFKYKIKYIGKLSENSFLSFLIDKYEIYSLDKNNNYSFNF